MQDDITNEIGGQVFAGLYVARHNTREDRRYALVMLEAFHVFPSSLHTYNTEHSI